MTDTIAGIEFQLQRIASLVPPGEDLKDYLRDLMDTQLAAMSDKTPMGIVPVSHYSARTAFSSARMAVEMVDSPEMLAEREEGIVDLGIIEWALRPALPLADNRFEPPVTGPWADLAADLVEAPARSVCRLDLVLRGAPYHIGTGFVAGEDAQDRLVIMTNRHVVSQARELGWTRAPVAGLACDFQRFSIDEGGPLYPLDEEYAQHPTYDLALVFLSKENVPPGADLPSPLRVAAEPGGEILDRRIGVLGHPALDSKFDSFLRAFGFGNEFGIKRFSPGEIRHRDLEFWGGHEVDAILHDASTLGGSSGSCMLDLVTMKVLGLHFGGWGWDTQTTVELGGEAHLADLYSANGAVPLWTLREDPLLRSVAFA